MTTGVPDVVGAQELTERWGISRQAVHNVTRRKGFPAGATLARGGVWFLADVESWEASERAAGRPLPGERPRGPAPRGGR